MATSIRPDALKTLILWMTVLLVLVVVVWQVLGFINEQSSRTSLTVNGNTYDVKVVSDEAEREKGLSGVQELGIRQGMLFIFNTDSTWGIWMKDMNFPIDILWINDEKQIVHIVKNASPDSYPDAVYRSRLPAKYVLEIPAGSVDRNNIQTGQRVTFEYKLSEDKQQ